jgi:hypothetical protein
MKDNKENQLKQAEWLRQHTLTQEQTRQLILNKLKRASEMHQALHKRDVSFQRQN